MAAWLHSTIVTILLVASSGCITGDAGPSDVHETDEPGGSPQFDETTGAVHGLITNEENIPVENAGVGLVERPEKTTNTSAAGEFTMSNVEPRTYTLAATALGYESGARTIDVTAGQVTEVTIVLVAIPVDAPYPTIQNKDGVLACSFRAYPGAPLTGVPGVLGLAPGWYTGVAVCGISPVNSTMGDKFLLNWDAPAGTREVLLEMKWTTNQALGRGLSVSVEDPSGINNGRPIYGTDTGPSPLMVFANETKALNVTTMNERDCAAGPCKYTTRVFAEANTTEFYLPADPPSVGPFGKPRNKVDAGIVTNQRFTQYLTTFHYMAAPQGFTALPEA